MSGQDNGEKKESTPTTAEATPAKKPYVAPKLRHLGSVRDLTYGTPQGGSDGGGTQGHL